MNTPDMPLSGDLDNLLSNIVLNDTGYFMWLERDSNGLIWLTCGCTTRQLAHDLAAGLRLMTRHRIECGTPAPADVDPEHTHREIQAADAQMHRVDSKTSMLLALSGTALSGGLAALVSGKLDGPAAGVAWLAVALLAAGVLVLGATVYPSLHARHGFMRWAATGSALELADLLASRTSADLAHELRSRSLALRAKYLRIRGAMGFLGLGVLAAIVAAALNSL